MKLLCTGDLHLGAGSEYGRRPGDRLDQQQQVWRRILELARDRDVDGILFAGDAFEGPVPTSEHYDAFLRPLREIWTDAEGPLPFLAISGNGRHDSAMRATNALKVFDGFGVTISSTPDVYAFAGCAIGTLPWVSPARLVASRNGGDRDEINADVSAMLIEVARGLKVDCEQTAPAAPHILLAHWSVSGSALPNGLPVAELREPVLPLADLEQLGFDAIVLGHIHQEQLLATDPHDPIIPVFYVGSPLPLNFGEAASRHGAWILELDHVRGATVPEFVPVDSPAFVTHDLDLTTDEGIFDLAALPDVPADAIVRVRFKATADQARSLDVAAWRRDLVEAGAAFVKVVPEIVRQDRARVAGLDEQVGELDALEQWMLAEGIVGVDEPWELAKPTAVLADAMRAKTAAYLETV